jgi:prevent-host-death family protein
MVAAKQYYNYSFFIINYQISPEGSMQVDIEKIVPVTEARDSFNKIVDEVEGSDELYVLTKNGKPAAVVAGVNHLEKLTGETESEVLAKVDSQPAANAPSGADDNTPLKPFQINNYDNVPAPTAPVAPLAESASTPTEPLAAPTAPADTTPTTPPPAPEPVAEATPATPDISTSAESAPAPEPYDPFKIPEDTPAESTGTPADTATPPPAATDSSTATPGDNPAPPAD